MAERGPDFHPRGERLVDFYGDVTDSSDADDIRIRTNVAYEGSSSPGPAPAKGEDPDEAAKEKERRWEENHPTPNSRTLRARVRFERKEERRVEFDRQRERNDLARARRMGIRTQNRTMDEIYRELRREEPMDMRKDKDFFPEDEDSAEEDDADLVVRHREVREDFLTHEFHPRNLGAEDIRARHLHKQTILLTEDNFAKVAACGSFREAVEALTVLHEQGGPASSNSEDQLPLPQAETRSADHGAVASVENPETPVNSCVCGAGAIVVENLPGAEKFASGLSEIEGLRKEIRESGGGQISSDLVRRARAASKKLITGASKLHGAFGEVVNDEASSTVRQYLKTVCYEQMFEAAQHEFEVPISISIKSAAGGESLSLEQDEDEQDEEEQGTSAAERSDEEKISRQVVLPASINLLSVGFDRVTGDFYFEEDSSSQSESSGDFTDFEDFWPEVRALAPPTLRDPDDLRALANEVLGKMVGNRRWEAGREADAFEAAYRAGRDGRCFYFESEGGNFRLLEDGVDNSLTKHIDFLNSAEYREHNDIGSGRSCDDDGAPAARPASSSDRAGGGAASSSSAQPSSAQHGAALFTSGGKRSRSSAGPSSSEQEADGGSRGTAASTKKQNADDSKAWSLPRLEIHLRVGVKASAAPSGEPDAKRPRL